MGDHIRVQGSRLRQENARSSDDYHPLDENEHYQLHYPLNRRPSHYHDFSTGPNSAPAVPCEGGDYFSWTSEPSELDKTNTQLILAQQNQDSHQHTTNSLIGRRSVHPTQVKSENKIRHRSNLSLTYTEEPVSGSLFARQDQAIVDSPCPQGGAGSPKNNETLAPQKTQKPRGGKNPGFILKLDELKHTNSPLHKVQSQHIALSGSLSDPMFRSVLDKMEFFDSDTFLQSSAGETQKNQGNITPLMFPPQADEHGYFGHIASNGTASYFEEGVNPGGYLNVTSKIHDPVAAGHSGASGNDSDGFSNYHVDDFAAVQSFEDNHYHESIREYPQEVEHTKAEAHFTPISSLHNDEDFHPNFEPHESRHRTDVHYYGHNQGVDPDQGLSDRHYNQEPRYTDSPGHLQNQRQDQHPQHAFQHGNYGKAHYQQGQYHKDQHDGSHHKHEYDIDKNGAENVYHHEGTIQNTHHIQPSNYDFDHGQRQHYYHEIKHAHNVYENSYLSSQQGQNHEGPSKAIAHEQHPFNTIHSQHTGSEGGVNFVEQNQQYHHHHHGHAHHSTSFGGLSCDELHPKNEISIEGEGLSDSQFMAQVVDSSDTDHPGTTDKKAVVKKRKGVKGIVCTVCDKFIVRDFSRHMRIHDEAGRFQCCFPPGYCKHKSRKFNRPYDYKKHLLNVHFKFDDPAAKLAVNLTEKLHVNGQCIACGQWFLANAWLEDHILTADLVKKCFELQRMEKSYRNDNEETELFHA